MKQKITRNLLWWALFAFLPLTLSAQEIKEVPGWSQIDQTLHYQPDNLWQYINGAAELYLSFGFEALHSSEWQHGDMVIIVDIYDMAQPINAFGIYTLEKPAGRPVLQTGTEAVISSDRQVLLLKNRFYVKIEVSGSVVQRGWTDGVIEAVAGQLPGDNAMPEALQRLPQQSKKPGSESFAREAFMGLSELNRCLYAEYTDEAGNAFRYFMILPSAGDSLRNVWEKLSDQWTPTSLDDKEILYRKIPYQGIIGVMKNGDWIVGATGCADVGILNKRMQVLSGPFGNN